MCGLAAEVSSPGFYRQDRELAGAVLSDLAELATELDDAYRRWEESDST